MANPAGALRIDLSANAAQFEKDMGRARKAVRNTTRSMRTKFDRFKTTVGNVTKQIFSFRSALIAVAGVSAMGFLIKRSIEAADQIGKTADRIGIGIEALQEYRHAAELAGVETKLLETSLTAMVRRMGEAIAGNKHFAEGFQRVGLSVEDLRNLAPDEVFLRVADGIDQMNLSADKIAAADKIFSEAGRRMINIFTGGAEALRRTRQEARDLGLVLDREMVREAEKANDQLTRMWRVLSTQLTRVIVSLAPQVIRLGEAFRAVVPDIIAFANRFVPDKFLPTEALRARIADIEAEIAGLTGMVAKSGTFGAIADAMRDGVFPPEVAERVSHLAGELLRLDEVLKERIRKDELVAASLEVMGDGAETAKDKVRELWEELNFEVQQLNRSEVEQELYNRAKSAGVEVNERFRREIGPVVSLLLDEKKAADKAKKAEQQRAEVLREGEALRDSLLTTQEIYNNELMRAAELLQENAISQDTFTRAVQNAKEKLQEANRETDKTIDLARDLGATFTSSFEEAIVSGGKLSDVLRGLERDILRIILRRMVLEPLVTAGLNFAGGLFSPAAAPQPAGLSLGNIGSGTQFASGGMHQGGFRIVGERGPELEATGPARYYSHDRTRGLLAGAEPGGDVTVNVYAPPGSSVEQRQSAGPGGRTVDVIIDEAVARNVATPGSRTNRAIRNSFAGVNPQLKGR